MVTIETVYIHNYTSPQSVEIYTVVMGEWGPSYNYGDPFLPNCTIMLLEQLQQL